MICSLNNNLKINNFFFYNSVVFSGSTLVINTGMSTAIVLNDIKTNGRFNAWMKDNSTLSSSFTIFAGVDVNVLNWSKENLIHSHLLPQRL